MADPMRDYISISYWQRVTFRRFYQTALSTLAPLSPARDAATRTFSSPSSVENKSDDLDWLQHIDKSCAPFGCCFIGELRFAKHLERHTRRDHLLFNTPRAAQAGGLTNFFSLPCSLRSEIYRLADEDGVYSSREEVRRLEFWTAIPFSRASVMTHEDVKALLYRETTVVIDLRRDLTWTLCWTNRISDGSLSTIRHFQIQGLCCGNGYGNGHAKILIDLDKQQKNDVITLDSQTCVGLEDHEELFEHVRELLPGLYSEQSGWNTTTMLRLLVSVSAAR